MISCIYYAVAGAANGQPICPTDNVRSRLRETLIWAARQSCASGFHVQILAYCLDVLWLRTVLEVPSARGIRHLLQFASGERETRGSSELAIRGTRGPFTTLRSVRLRTIEDQLSAVRHCHFAPVHLGLAEHPQDWRWSSHRVYLGLDRTLGLHRGLITSLLAEGPGGWPLAYSRLMRELEAGERRLKLPALEISALPEATADGDVACLRALAAHPGERTRERVFRNAAIEICDLTGSDPEEFLADPSDRRFRLERALLLEEFTVRQPRIINVRQLALRLHSDRSWLYRTRAECRVQYPEFFTRYAQTPDASGSGAVQEE